MLAIHNTVSNYHLMYNIHKYSTAVLQGFRHPVATQPVLFL